ncbi:MAG: hypothetical protein QXK33_02265 [Candidatus Bathyarchaeia archaeon]
MPTPWTDIDFERNTIRISPEKGSSPRMLNLKQTLVNFKEDEYIAKVAPYRRGNMPTRRSRLRICLRYNGNKIFRKRK